MVQQYIFMLSFNGRQNVSVYAPKSMMEINVLVSQGPKTNEEELSCE